MHLQSLCICRRLPIDASPAFKQQLEQAKQAWEQNRVHILDFLSEGMRQQRASKHTFVNVDEALRACSELTGKQVTPLPQEPKLANFYVPSEDQKIRQFIWIIPGTTLVGSLVYRFA